jgi:hypothetical protein
VVADGTALRVEPFADGALEERGGRLIIPASGVVIDDEDVQALRDADQR